MVVHTQDSVLASFDRMIYNIWVSGVKNIANLFYFIFIEGYDFLEKIQNR